VVAVVGAVVAGALVARVGEGVVVGVVCEDALGVAVVGDAEAAGVGPAVVLAPVEDLPERP